VLGRGILEPNLFEALDHKNPARIRDLCQRYGLQAERARALEALPMLTGGPEVMQRARALDFAKFLDDGGAKALQALSELDELAQLLAAAGAQQGVIFDLGEVRSFQYYSGFTFRIYHPLLGEDLGGGGRYDGLFDRFRLSVPAVGFGLNLARLAEVTPENPYAADGAESIDASRGPEALKRLAQLRAQGKPVILKGGA
jgi:ATP phosphoribosyltransferase regulatory subunit